MTMNLRADDTFVEDDGWHAASRRYSRFLNDHQDQKVLFLDLGTGGNTPGIIKYPFWQMTCQWPDATYACINLGEAGAPGGNCGKVHLHRRGYWKGLEANLKRQNEKHIAEG